MKNIGLLALALVLPLVSTGAQQQTSDASHSALASKRPPQARSWAEYNDYKSTYALNGGLAVEKAADDFATKYPQSELREYLYSKAMHEYQKENNPQKILAMGERVLSLDADDSIALVLTGTVIADQLGDGDKNRDEEIAEIETNCKHALETVDAGYTPPSNVAPEQIAAYKSTIQSMAHSAL